MATCYQTLAFTATSAAEYAEMKLYVAAHVEEVNPYAATWDDGAMTLTLTKLIDRGTDWSI